MTTTPAGRSAGPRRRRRISHHQRGRRRPAHPAARAALLGDEIPPGEAAEAWRRPALLPARRHRAAAADFDLLYIQGYTIKGVQRLLREGGGRLSDDIPPPSADEQADDEHEAGAPGDAHGGAHGATQGLPMLPGFPPAGPPPRPPSRGRPEHEVERLRAVLTETLRELEALRSLLP